MNLNELSAISGPFPSLEDVAIRITDPVTDGPPDIIPGLLPRQGQLVIAGETNVGKSLVALEIISSLTTGTPLWGELHPTMQAKKVLYVLGEHYDAVIQRLWQKTQLPLGDKVFLLGPEALGYDKWLVGAGKPNLLALEKFKKWTDGCDLVVFDPLSAFLTGAENAENDNLVMRLVLDSMSTVCQANGAACLVLAHQGKPMMDPKGQEHARKSYAIRGGSSVEDAATNIFYMGAAEKSPSTQVAKGSIFDLRLRKYKGEAPANYRLLRDPATLTHTLLGEGTPYADVIKYELNAKVARLQAAMPDFNYRTAVRVVAACEGKPEETVKRWLGVAK